MIAKIVIENTVITVEEITQHNDDLFCVHLKEVREFINNKQNCQSVYIFQ